MAGLKEAIAYCRWSYWKLQCRLFVDSRTGISRAAHSSFANTGASQHPLSLTESNLYRIEVEYILLHSYKGDNNHFLPALPENTIDNSISPVQS